LRKGYAGRETLAGVDLELSPGEIVGLLGPSGSGKSTIFGILAGALRPDAGEVTLDGRDITGACLDARARLGLSYVSQNPALFAALTCEDNLRLSLEAKHDDPERIDQILDVVCRAFRLGEFRHARIAHLSGGQRKRVEIAFAICTRPRYLLLDEPFAGLDPIGTTELTIDIQKLASLGVAILITDHKVREALSLVERAYIIDQGVIIATGPSQDIIADELVRSVFLGQEFSL
jgi:lipopolysaccharide export system ATP-binding protein